MMPAVGRVPISSPSAKNDDVGATRASPPARGQTSISDIERWDRDPGVSLRQTPESPQVPQKRATRSLQLGNTLEKNGGPERKTRKSRRNRVCRRPTCSSLRRRAHKNGPVSTPETVPSEVDASAPTASSSQQSLARDPSSRPRSETAGRDDEAPDFDAIRASLAPFDMNNELGEWEFSKEEGKWWRLNKTTNTVIYAPTADMFF